MMAGVNREGKGGHRRYAGRHLSAVYATKIRRGLLAALASLAVVLAGSVPVAAADAPDSIQGLDATYDVAATIKWSVRKLIVSSRALVTNHSDVAIDALTFNIAPAVIGRMRLDGVTSGTDTAAATVDDQNVIVTLPVPLKPAAQVPVTIDYTSWFGYTGGNKQWLFSKTSGVATAYRWVPWLSRAHPFHTPTYGEPFVTKAADDIRVKITTDREVAIAASGEQTAVEGLTKTFWAHNVRDFNFSASPHYSTHTDTWHDVKITYFTRNLPLDKLQKWTVAALERFSDKVGPYPYNHLSVSEVPTGPSMESPAMVWITEKAVAKGTLKFLVIHEMAHQWFYGVLGDDQAVEPFADEALAEFVTRDMIGHRGSHCPQGALDKTVYDYTASCYYEVLYVQGDLWLDNYRTQVGNDAFWAGIRQYYNDYKFKIGGTLQLLKTLDAAAGQPGATHGDRFPTLYP